MQISPILLEVFKNRFASIAEEMGVTLTHTAFSPNIKERRDLSCAVFDEQGDMIAQAAHIPVHLGSMPLSVKAAMAAMEEEGGFAPGDMAMLNDPFKGGTHLPDITIVAPVFAEGKDTPSFFVANRAHHADVGGMAAGSMPLSTSLFQEGLIIPPVRIVRRGETDRELMRLILNNVRTPLEREGDFAAQFMANVTGVRRMTECVDKYGLDTCTAYARALMDYSERVTRQAVKDIPDGEYEYEDFLDDDGMGAEAIPIRLNMTVAGDSARLDFSASGDQVRGSVNAVRSITLSAVLYVFRSLAGRDIPANAGCLRPIEVVTRPGSILDARFPAAVAGGNVETSQRTVDVILGALSLAMPDAVPASSQGTMNNLTIGGQAEGKPFAYYETLAGGMGASPEADGESGVHSHMTNTLNTPVEALEYAYPMRVREYAVLRGTGGRGRHSGGDGMVRDVELLTDCDVTVLSERRKRGAPGTAGGEPGQPGRNVLITGTGPEPLPGKFHRSLNKGDRIRIETPGGGGFGTPEE
ncbi:hydantoinase B/oxoprolinase family protein [Pseudodesulfovibrio portus]|uniref:N-methylhydantoinase B n=1 Tax=Pseudodesulfovibrio portus TaxID=231439 RepID=A0ABM8AV41_9BACT|nr:hydantoinase B/oxoprolinase family protein [Pseudodesulfovibrio portus]BDQ35362.1 N-methylhydantoinase B [Pseudodesulfovibrio portus]